MDFALTIVALGSTFLGIGLGDPKIWKIVNRSLIALFACLLSFAAAIVAIASQGSAIVTLVGIVYACVLTGAALRGAFSLRG